ncbi:MAG: FAD-binding oxidoreductase [Hyphomonadaceae bacterium]|nr:MAG: FAD linked oxidase domain-containing protein [Caulobacteraceae bacterium]MBT9445176.1 FAD-binding oxidoreductase [Hyphomonadaceae bacterium]TPW07714.1 MAG: FAD linked oxidase domain-containing protein [Alphaproteobacteria bacterium]
MTNTAALLEKLRAGLSAAAIVTDPAIIAPHLEEWRARGVGNTPFLLTPGSVEEVAQIVRLCAEAGVAITPQGGNTGLVGGQTPQGEVLISLKRMNRVRGVDATADVITVEAGAILANVHDAANAAGRRFPLSLGSQGSATIGGLISTNAGGVHVLRFGMMRDLVLGIEAVLPDGQIFHGLRSLRKDNTGYDLKQLFIGAEGSLGVVTAATLRLFPRPAGHLVAMVALETPEAALELLQRARDETGALAAFEIMNRTSVELARNLPGVRVPFDPPPPWLALLEFESAVPDGFRDSIEAMLASAIDDAIAQDATIAESEKAAADFWSLRELMAAAHRTVKTPQVSHDTSTPVSAVPAFLHQAGAAVERLSPGVRIVAFGHAGDGNIHYTAIAANAESRFPAEQISAAVHDVAYALGGSISAEHGIGVFRRAELVRFKDPVALATMRAVKHAIDPLNIMNPRVLFEPD